MFRHTFLGHAGWMSETERTRLLIDPLAIEPFGHGGVVGFLYPPRRFDVTKVPPVDAIIYSHEHEDHFNIPSLNRFDRKIPIYIPARCSVAARQILVDMGFKVTLTVPDATYQVGDLKFSVFGVDQHAAGVDQVDEYDVLPILVRDDAGHGNFFTSIDVVPRTSLLGSLKKLVPAPGIWSFTNNITRFDFMTTGEPVVPLVDESELLVWLARDHARLKLQWTTPALWLVAGGGVSFGDERAWLNNEVFPIDNERVVEAARQLYPEQRFLAPVAGQSALLRDLKCVEVSERCPFLITPPRGEWPDRAFRPSVKFLQRYAPGCGRTDFDADELDELYAELAEFARYLHSTRLFTSLYSLDGEKLGARKPTFALMLLANSEYDSFVLEYDPSTCAFVESDSDDPTRDYIAVAEMWATDLLAVLRGNFGPSGVVFSRMRTWNHLGGELKFDVQGAIWKYTHPLNRPERFLRLYRNLLEHEPAGVPHIPAR